MALLLQFWFDIRCMSEMTVKLTNEMKGPLQRHVNNSQDSRTVSVSTRSLRQ